MLPQVKYIKEFVGRDQIYVECAPSITERIVTSFMRQECVIENYSKLKEKIYYRMTCKEEFPERTLKLYKTNRMEKISKDEKKRIGIHWFQFHCDLPEFHIHKTSGRQLTNKMECYIKYDQSEIISLGDCVETRYGFLIEVTSEIIANLRNKYLWENDKLILHFHYRNFYYPRGPICRSGLPRKEDEERLSEDLLALYESGKFADFALKDKDDKAHWVHKSICRTRSTVIDNIDDVNVVALTVKGRSKHLEMVIRYMYSGILPQLSIDDLLQVLEVAEELNIKRLILSIKLALARSINESNAERILKVTSTYYNMSQIVPLAEEFKSSKNRKEKSRK